MNTTITNKTTMELFLAILENNPDEVMAVAANCQSMPSEITLDEIKDKANKMIASYTSKSKSGEPTDTYRENETKAKALAEGMTMDDVINSNYVCEKFGFTHKQKATSVIRIAIALGLLEKAPKIKGESLVRYRLVGSTAGEPEPTDE